VTRTLVLLALVCGLAGTVALVLSRAAPERATASPPASESEVSQTTPTRPASWTTVAAPPTPVVHVDESARMRYDRVSVSGRPEPLRVADLTPAQVDKLTALLAANRAAQREVEDEWQRAHHRNRLTHAGEDPR
jgi:hypothetical protein